MCEGHHFPFEENRETCAVCAAFQDAFTAYRREFRREVFEAADAETKKRWAADGHPAAYEVRSLKKIAFVHLKRVHGRDEEPGMLI